MGNLRANQEETEEATRAADVHDLIAQLPERYDTPAEERGERLLGGQRQRVGWREPYCGTPRSSFWTKPPRRSIRGTEAAILNTLERAAPAPHHRLGDISLKLRDQRGPHPGYGSRLACRTGQPRTTVGGGWRLPPHVGKSRPASRWTRHATRPRSRSNAWARSARSTECPTRCSPKREPCSAPKSIQPAASSTGRQLWRVALRHRARKRGTADGKERRRCPSRGGFAGGGAFGESSLLESEPESETRPDRRALRVPHPQAREIPVPAAKRSRVRAVLLVLPAAACTCEARICWLSGDRPKGGNSVT